jgi:hypothetical protein
MIETGHFKLIKIYFSQANMYLNALQQQSLGMDIVVKVIIIILWAGLCKYIGIVLNHCVDQEIVISIIEDRAQRCCILLTFIK